MADSHTTRVLAPPLRPEYISDVIAGGDIGVVQKPLTVWQRLVNQSWARKVLILVVIAAAWQAYAVYLNNGLLVPTFTATLEAFKTGMTEGTLLEKVWNSVLLLLKGYAVGLTLAMAFTAIRCCASSTAIVRVSSMTPALAAL